MDQQTGIRGRCLCGAVRFHLLTPTDFCGHCHCESCRRAHGSAFTTWTSVPQKQFVFDQGESLVQWYASSPWVQWGFCPQCGSSMFYRAVRAGHPENPRTEVVYVTVGNLIDPMDRSPEAHVSFEEHVSWIDNRDRLPRFRGKTEERIRTT